MDDMPPPIEKDAAPPESGSAEVRIDAPIGDDPAELAAIADAVVRGCCICHAEIRSLRKLIEAVQAHPDAKLAPPRDERPDDWKPPDPNAQNALTQLEIGTGAILDGHYQLLDVRVTLVCSASFAEVARFERASFAGWAVLHRASFADEARFDGASFAGWAWFGGASFAGATSFDDASFAGWAWFNGASFAGDARFAGARFADLASFDRASFAERVTGDFRRCSLRTALFAEAAKEEIQRRQRARTKRQDDGRVGIDHRLPAPHHPPDRPTLPLRAWRWCERWATRTFGWHTVRNLGQLAILSRVSIVAILAVPVIVALWNTAQAILERFAPGHAVPDVGDSLALAFLAAVAVTLGLLVYQVFAPDDVRKHDEDAFIDMAHQRYPEDAPDREDGLRRAIEHLEQIARRRPDRHENFVTHHGDTIWVPPRQRIDWFDDPDPSPPARPTDEPDPPGDQELRSEPRPLGSDDRAPAPTSDRFEGVPGAERRRIVIEEGARAEYWLKCREKVVWAAVSFGLYLLGIGFLLCILVIQILAVSRAAGWL